MARVLAVNINEYNAVNPVCLACAEKVANDSGYPNLFWMIHHPIEIDGDVECKCRRLMGSVSAADAADRVLRLMQGAVAEDHE